MVEERRGVSRADTIFCTLTDKNAPGEQSTVQFPGGVFRCLPDKRSFYQIVLIGKNI